MASRRPLARYAARLAACLGALLLAACLGLLLLAWCQIGFVFGEGDERFDDLDAVPAWFEEHRGELEVIMRLLEPHDSVHRVWRSKPDYTEQQGQFSPTDEAAYAGAFAIKERLGIPLVIVWRREGGTPAFKFILWRIGIAVSGRATSIQYAEEKESIFNYYDTPPNKALDLGAPNWFASRSSSD